MLHIEVIMSRVFQVLNIVHYETLAHAGVNKIVAEIARKYAGIPKRVVQLFVSLCPPCSLSKLAFPRQTVSVIVSSQIWERLQMGFIDMQ